MSNLSRLSAYLMDDESDFERFGKLTSQAFTTPRSVVPDDYGCNDSGSAWHRYAVDDDRVERYNEMCATIQLLPVQHSASVRPKHPLIDWHHTPISETACLADQKPPIALSTHVPLPDFLEENQFECDHGISRSSDIEAVRISAENDDARRVYALPGALERSMDMTPRRHSGLGFLCSETEICFQDPFEQHRPHQVHQAVTSGTLQNDVHTERREDADFKRKGLAEDQIHRGGKVIPRKRKAASGCDADPENPPSPFAVNMSIPSDKTCLTAYQLLLRQSLEYFSATQYDVKTRVRGRKQMIQLRQVGVRCRYCSHLQLSQRGTGAVYYPKSLRNVYQAAQNIAGAHFCADKFFCPLVPKLVSEEMIVQKPRRDSSGAGRSYWLEACKSMGVFEDEGKLWLRGFSGPSG